MTLKDLSQKGNKISLLCFLFLVGIIASSYSARLLSSYEVNLGVLALMNQQISPDTDSPHGLYSSLVIQRRDFNLEDAASYFEHAISDDISNVNAHYYLGLIALYRGDTTLAEDSLRHVLVQEKYNVMARLSIGYVYFLTERQALALGQWRLSGAFPYFLSWGKAFVRTDMRAAEHNLLIAYFLKSCSFEANYRLSGLYSGQGRYEEAIYHGMLATEMDPTSNLPYHQLGLIFWKMGQPDQAMYYFDQAAQRAPDFWSILYLARLNFSQDKYDLAIGYTQQAIVLDPSSAEAHYWLGRALFEYGRVDSALIELEMAMCLSPPIKEYPYVSEILRSAADEY